MATIKKYNGSSWENAVVRKFGTATEAVENPLYSDGTAITAYTIKGNEEHTGTPSPQNPVMPNGVGVRTENIIDNKLFYDSPNYKNCTRTLIPTGVRITATGDDCYINSTIDEGVTLGSWAHSACIPVKSNTTYTLYLSSSPKCYISQLDSSYTGTSRFVKLPVQSTPLAYTFTTDSTAAYIFIRLGNADLAVGDSYDFTNIMLVEGETAPDHYIPYGYKIGISSGGVTTNIYLGSTQTVRKIKKLVLNGEESWGVSSGTTVYYVNDLVSDYLHEAKKVTVCSHFDTQINTNSASNIESNTLCFRNSSDRLYINSPTHATTTDFTTYLQQQYANGTPVTVWYVLATPKTATVNEPLMKIGDYADTVSNATSIPTTEGANSITVDTTVQPSEFTATWTGWHDVSVKEYVTTTTIADLENESISQMENHTIQEIQGGNWV